MCVDRTKRGGGSVDPTDISYMKLSRFARVALLSSLTADLKQWLAYYGRFSDGRPPETPGRRYRS